MRPEARPIEFTNGRTHFYGKKKVDTQKMCWGFHKNIQQHNSILHVVKWLYIFHNITALL